MSTEPPKFYWRQTYELGRRVHWALCDTQTDAEGPPARVTCPEMILESTWENGIDGRPVSEQRFPKLIAELLTKHFAEQQTKTRETPCH